MNDEVEVGRLAWYTVAYCRLDRESILRLCVMFDYYTLAQHMYTYLYIRLRCQHKMTRWCVE